MKLREIEAYVLSNLRRQKTNNKAQPARSKFQIPSTKLQINPKTQYPIIKTFESAVLLHFKDSSLPVMMRMGITAY
jgi:hypothetical protein